jgi:hypothetical protein
VDINEDDKIDARVFKTLVRAAVAHNTAKVAAKRKKA